MMKDERKSNWTLWLISLLIISGGFGLFLIIISFIGFFINTKENESMHSFFIIPSIFVMFVTGGFVLFLGSISYSINFWHKEKHRDEEHFEQQKNADIEYLKTMKDDVNNYLRYLEENHNKPMKSNKSLKFKFNDQKRYLYELQVKITNLLGDILSGKKKGISEEEKLKLRTNTAEDFIYIGNEMIKNNKNYKWFKASNFNLQYKKFSQNFNWKGINFNNADLRLSNLEDLTLNGLKLEEIDLSDAKIYAGEFKFLNFEGSYLDNSEFSGVNLENASIKTSSLINTSFIGCNLSNFNFVNSTLLNTSFSNCILTDVDFLNSKILDIKFDESFILEKKWKKIKNLTKANNWKRIKIIPKSDNFVNNYRYLNSQEIEEIEEYFKEKENEE